MAKQSINRRLAAILAADVANYTRMMNEDEASTMEFWWTYRNEVIDPTIEKHQGRIVKHTGDGFLAEFSTVQDAVQSAFEIQSEIKQRNIDVPEDKRMEFRMGVNLGDIIVDDEDIYGDGVNIAARLEGLADPGGIFVSGDVFNQVHNKLDLTFEDLGEKTVKNIPDPIRVHRILLEEIVGDIVRKELKSSLVGSPRKTEAKPSIAVLPFVNMGGDPEQEYFADGLTEDIITSLSKVRWFFVISRNSTFAYKGKSPDIRDVGKELGVRYVLEGSVRQSGNRVRLTAQLIDCATGNHLWAERYDRQLEDIFDLQDELTQTVVGAIEPQLSKAERDRARMHKPNNLDAWNLLQYGRAHLYKRSKEDLEQARAFLEKAIKLDPELISAFSDLAEVCFLEVRLGFADDNQARLAEAVDLSNRAIEIKGEDAAAHYALGRVLSMKRQHPEAQRELKRALELNPSYSQAYLAIGMSYAYSGLAEEAVEPLDTGMRLSPHDEYMGPFMARMAEAYLFMRDHEKAAEWGRRAALQPNLPWPGYASLVSILGHLGLTEELATAIPELEKRAPKTDLTFIRKQLPITHESDLDHFIDGLRKAGLTDE